MAIRAGQILTVGGQYVLDRLQTVGPGNLNQPKEKIYETGNYQTVATIRDIPDLSFDMESFDMSCETEAVLTGADPTAIVDGQEFDFTDACPIDVISPFKSRVGQYDIVEGAAVPYLILERAQYRFGLRQNATQTFTLRGDSVYYVPGTPYYEEFTNLGATTYSFANTGIEYVESGDSIYAYCVSLYDSTSGAYKRLFIGNDYTNTSSGFTLLADNSATYDTIKVVYGSAVAATYSQTVHENVSVKPAAIRAKDIDVYIGTSDATPVFTRWDGVQSVDVSWAVNLQFDDEFGNSHHVDAGYDVADVTGSIVVRSETPENLFAKIAQAADVASNKTVGPYTSTFLPMEIRISDPDSGDVIKTIYIPDVRFTTPGFSARVQNMLDVTFAFESDGGTMLVYNGER